MPESQASVSIMNSLEKLGNAYTGVDVIAIFSLSNGS
jgi:hypothetical protein